MKYANELNKLKSLVSEEVWELFEKYSVIIGGGAITSVFCNRDVNDLDIYLRSESDFFALVEDLYNDYNFTLISANMTDRSILFRDAETKQDVQLIVYKFFKDADDLFNDYDFTVNMGALYCKTGLFQFHDDFFKHNSQRYLQFHTGTTYPLISALRVQKYKDKGYTISKAQMLRLLLTISKLEINSWEDIKDHCGGFYGLNMDEVFPEDKEFSMDLAIETLDKVFSDNKFKTEITNIFELDIYNKFLAKYDLNKRESPDGRYFKNVTIKDGKLVSVYTLPAYTFEYKLNETVNGGKNGIYCYNGNDVLTGIYSNADAIILELIPDINATKLETQDFPNKIQLMGDVRVVAVYTKDEYKTKFKSTNFIEEIR